VAFIYAINEFEFYAKYYFYLFSTFPNYSKVLRLWQGNQI